MNDGFSAGIEAAANVLDEAAQRHLDLAEKHKAKGETGAEAAHRDSFNVRCHYAQQIRSLQPSAPAAVLSGSEHEFLLALGMIVRLHGKSEDADRLLRITRRLTGSTEGA